MLTFSPSTRLLAWLSCLLLAMPATAAPTASPLDNAKLSLTSGQAVTFAPFRGRLTVLNFWATWCAPCRQEMPMLSQLATKLAGRGIKVVGIALDQPDQVQAFLKQTPVNYPILMSDGDGTAIMRSLGNKSGGLPYTVILDARGKPVKQLLGLLDESALHKALDGL